MLKSEQAQNELEKVKVQNWQKSRLDALKKLPAALRRVAQPLVGVDGDGEDLDYEQQSKLRDEVLPLAAGMTKRQRVDLFETLFPGLGAAVENGWQLLNELPHSMASLDVETKAFRLPGQDALLLKRRLQWVESLLGVIGEYPGKDLAWHATWAGHHGDSESVSILLAAAIDAGGKTGDEVFEILRASACAEHEVGVMGRHVVQSFLCASRPDGWEFIERLLLAAQRQEGLRQSILETADLARPEAFRRMLRVILDHNLVRFSATVRALDVWLGYQWDSVSTGVVNQVIQKLRLYLEDGSARAAALKGKDAEQAFLALWTVAFDNAVAALEPARALLQHPKAEFRFVAARLLSMIDIPAARQVLVSVLDDEDLHVVCCALDPHEYGDMDESLANSDFFERLEKMLPRFPEKKTHLKPLVWPWTDYTVNRELVSGILIKALGKRPATRLIPHLAALGNYERAEALGKLAEPEKAGAAAREAFLDWISDAARQVRDAALAGLQKCSAEAADAPRLEALLTRTAGDLRRGILGLLLKLPDADALASADRLLAGSAPQRLAGLELLRQLTDDKRCLAEARERTAAFRKSHPKLAQAERQQIENIETARADKLTLDNALGLIRDEERTWPAKPVNRKALLHSPAAVRLIAALDELVHQHREQTIKLTNWNDETGDETKEMPLGDIDYRFDFPKPDGELPLDRDRARLPLLEVWENWWQARGKDLRDADGFELLRALTWYGAVLGEHSDKLPVFRKRCRAAMEMILGRYKASEVRHSDVVPRLLNWLLRLHPPAGAAEFILSAMETSFALAPETELRHVPDEDDYDDEAWRGSDSVFMAWDNISYTYEDYVPGAWTGEQHIRRYRLLRWCDQPFGRTGNLSKAGKPLDRSRPHYGILLDAGATDADVIEHLLGPRPADDDFYDLRILSNRAAADLKKYPAVKPLVERCCARVLEVELTRGDTPTPASGAALCLSAVYGIANLVAILQGLGSRNFFRGWINDNDSKEAVFSHLTRVSRPAAGETVQDFARQVAAAQIPEARLVELALFAPQWAAHVEHALGWKSLAEGVWWIHAHTRGKDWSVDEDDDSQERWKADLSQHTALAPEDLLEGAVDVAWFRRVQADLGDARWSLLDEAAKYASEGGGHARARLFADAMLGRVTKKDLLTRMQQKRHQDSARALGLLPLAEGKAREADLLERYTAIQEFIRTGRQFGGSHRQASEKRAAQIAQENLARTAGFPDPVRLQWAMEARAVADLADGPISITTDGVTVSLSLDPWGEIQLEVTQGGKTLAEIPAKLKKDKQIAALRERKTELKQQAARIRGALEQFMCRGTTVTGAELQELMKHPLLAPMLGGLVLAGDGVLGYPVHGGRALEDYAGAKEALKQDEPIRIAHPLDLLPAAKWHAWQKDCFARERIQPFKQVFRELYTLTKPEKDEGTQSRRYAGHQVQPRQALALLGARGWVHHPEEGVRKTYHDAGVTVWLEFDEPFFTPAEIEGLTLESVHFTQRGGEQKPIKLTALPPRLFSETMRDLDLVVSVAHRGGVDPEASASTLEMRAALVKETCALLKLANVKVKDNAVLIQGSLGEYRVHLGSAVTRKVPGETLFIVAVHSQHRGRLFLPFADDDPRTAEVLSKVLLLARDQEIKDPNILEQLRR